jgi:hypothetical protein
MKAYPISLSDGVICADTSRARGLLVRLLGNDIAQHEF